MSFNDWKAALQGLDITEGAEPTDGQTTPQADLNNPEGKDALSPQEPATLHVVMERKGRGLRTAVVVRLQRLFGGGEFIAARRRGAASVATRRQCRPYYYN